MHRGVTLTEESCGIHKAEWRGGLEVERPREGGQRYGG